MDIVPARIPHGFLPGRAKTGGRLPGVPNRDRTVTIKNIVAAADPIGGLCAVARGEPRPGPPDPDTGEPTLIYPTMADQLSAMRTLAAKVMPDLKQVSVTDNGSTVTVLLQLAQKVTVGGG